MAAISRWVAEFGITWSGSEAGVPPYVIFHDRTLTEIAAQRPANDAALEQITGLGARKIARFGAALIDTLSQFKPHPLLQNRLSATVNQTLALHLQGHDAIAIAARRNLEMSTVLGHFAEATLDQPAAGRAGNPFQDECRVARAVAPVREVTLQGRIVEYADPLDVRWRQRFRPGGIGAPRPVEPLQAPVDDGLGRGGAAAAAHPALRAVHGYRDPRSGRDRRSAMETRGR